MFVHNNLPILQNNVKNSNKHTFSFTVRFLENSCSNVITIKTNYSSKSTQIK